MSTGGTKGSRGRGQRKKKSRSRQKPSKTGPGVEPAVIAEPLDAAPSPVTRFECFRALSSEEVLWLRQDEDRFAEEAKAYGASEDVVEGAIHQLLLDTTRQSHTFPSELSPADRKRAHMVAERLGLQHVSVGKGKNRRLVVTKPEEGCSTEAQVEDTIREVVSYKGHLELGSAMVDAIARKSVPRLDGRPGSDGEFQVPMPLVQQRLQRDGPHHHITLVTKREVTMLRECDRFSHLSARQQIAALVDSMKGVVASDWCDVGIGRVVDAKLGHECYYRIIDWPSAQSWRQGLGLSAKDFHITIGFDGADVHEVAKDASTRISL